MHARTHITLLVSLASRAQGRTLAMHWGEVGSCIEAVQRSTLPQLPFPRKQTQVQHGCAISGSPRGTDHPFPTQCPTMSVGVGSTELCGVYYQFDVGEEEGFRETK